MAWKTNAPILKDPYDESLCCPFVYYLKDSLLDIRTIDTRLRLLHGFY